MRFRIKTILVAIALLAVYLGYVRLFLDDFADPQIRWVATFAVILPLVVVVALVGPWNSTPKRPAQRPTAEDRPLD
jgi:ABC-type transport system involved in cytochrome c biogenesis permease component